MRLNRVNPRRARVNACPADPGNPHFIVVRGLDRYGRVNIADQGFGNRTMSVAGFESVWQGGIWL
jgi:predicted double-glycine peptidase